MIVVCDGGEWRCNGKRYSASVNFEGPCGRGGAGSMGLSVRRRTGHHLRAGTIDSTPSEAVATFRFL